MDTFETQGYAAYKEKGDLIPYGFKRREPRSHDVHMRVLYCGVCHSDVSYVNSEWESEVVYPIVPGHEIVGKVERVGSSVTKFKVGDYCAVGCMVDACSACKYCTKGAEPYCSKAVFTYNSKLDGAEKVTKGGYSKDLVVDEKAAFVVPKALHGQLPRVAPLLCAGITVYAAMRHFKMDTCGARLGVVGLGGLGHVAVKFGKAFKQHVTVISSNPGKREGALQGLGADAFLLSRDDKQMEAAKMSFDFIVDTASCIKEMQKYVQLLDVDGKIVVLGLPHRDFAMSVYPRDLTHRRRSIMGSLIGGLQETQDMLDFCAKTGIVCDVEMIEMKDINQVFAKLQSQGDVKYRYVIDVQKNWP